VEDILVEASGHECNVTLSTWLKDLLPRIPGANQKVVKRELVLAAREFYEQSTAWRVVIGPRDLTADKKRYVMSPYDAYANIVRVLGVEFSGNPLPAIYRKPPKDDSTSVLGYWLDGADHVCLWPVPKTTVEDALTFYVALTPKQTVTTLPQIAASHHYDALLDGTLGRLYSHPAKAYSDLVRAQYHLKRFRSAIGKYAGLAKQGMAGAQSWSYPRFGK
jgi:hypothetical protein